MHEDDDTPTAVLEPAAPHAGSLRDRLRKKREQARDRPPQHFDIPGFDGDLVALYKLLGYDELARREQMVEKQAKKVGVRANFYGQCSTVAEACEEILAKDPDTGELTPLAEIIGDGLGPVRYDMRLAAYLAKDGEDIEYLRGGGAGAVVRFVVPVELAVSTHHTELVSWMREGNEEADDEFLGESTAAGR